MDSFRVIFVLIIINIIKCHAELTWEDLNLLAKYRRLMDNKEKIPTIFNPNLFSRKNFQDADTDDPYLSSRRLLPGMKMPILGTPTNPNHLPEAEPILPGHTLIRPSRGMLKSAVKFPHKDLDGESGVYGNIKNLGITYSGTGERVLYTGFRRNLADFMERYKNDSPDVIVAFLYKERGYQDKPALRYYIDYGEREKQIAKQKEEEEQEMEKRNNNPIYDFLVKQNEEQKKKTAANNNKRLIKTLISNGVTLEFFQIPRLNSNSMEEEDHPESVKPYDEFNDATRIKNTDW